MLLSMTIITISVFPVGYMVWMVGKLEHLEPVVLGHRLILTAAHERRVHMAAVEPLEAPGLGVLLGEWHGPAK